MAKLQKICAYIVLAAIAAFFIGAIGAVLVAAFVTDPWMTVALVVGIIIMVLAMQHLVTTSYPH